MPGSQRGLKVESKKFLVKGSAESPYEVIFQKDGARLSASCTCAAGGMGQSCKHRLSLLEGNADGVVSDNVFEIGVISTWLSGSTIANAMAEVAAADRDLERAKKAVVKARKNLAAAMR